MTERLLIMRHGEAGPGRPDAGRELTRHGQQQVRRMAAWLAGRDDLGGLRLLASPYRRAQQTAALVAEALGGAEVSIEVETLGRITPDDSPQAVADWLVEQAPGRPLMLVSHMPLVGALAGLLVEGREDRGLGFPTAAVAEFEADVWAAGCARLARFITPAELG
uniref:phosphohistidine phosphatase SixA n=1 Tax=uncultured Halomonas sp. TaxID=173971 RepID=UPI002610AF59|nr:phosphohistidine phosphatase SixA [uncultured Halomonas sp.]